VIRLPSKTFIQKHSEDRKMEDRKIFAVRSIPHRRHPWHDAKRHISVFHFSVLAFIQANLTLPS
jgi:hypothetical protein